VKTDADPVVLSFHQFWMTGLISLAVALLSGSPLAVRGARCWSVIIFLAAVPTLSAFYIQMVAQKRSGPFKVGVIFALEPVFAALFAWTIGGEPFVPAKAAGGLLVVGAILAGELGRLGFARASRKEILPL
jgi:drug/metabolite transporter (DMT)-like permease